MYTKTKYFSVFSNKFDLTEALRELAKQVDQWRVQNQDVTIVREGFTTGGSPEGSQCIHFIVYSVGLSEDFVD